MVDRFLVWLGAGVVTAGVAAAMVAGAGFAVADETSASGTGGETTSESSNSTETSNDSSTDPADPNDADEPGADPDTTDPDEPDAVDPDTDAGEEEPAEPSEEEKEEKKSDSNTSPADRAATEAAKPKQVDTRDANAAAEVKAEDKAVTEKDEEASTEPNAEPATAVVEEKSVVLESVADEIIETPAVAAVAFASAPSEAATATATAPQIPGVIRVIGTIVFNLYAIATRVFGGPPILPPGSTVTVRSSSLVLECGCDEGDEIEVPADWYIPEGAEEDPPQRLIYLQHGILASGPWYSHTAAALAEQTNSIVVAPSITSNFLSADACWLGAAPMHQAIAKLFNADNTALAQSALAAGYAGPIPDRVVLIGHSLGGGAVSGTAGYMADNGTDDRLAGVILLDGVGLDDTMADSLKKVPVEIPIYQLAAPKYFWNQFGVGNDALLEARGDQFIGVTLVGGSHVDGMRGGNPLIQFSQQLVSGVSKPQNVEAARILMVGWVEDMFAGNQEHGIYPTDEVSILTPEGEAIAVALPNSLTKPFFLNFLQPFVALANGFFTFEPVCVAESIGASCEEPVAA